MTLTKPCNILTSLNFTIQMKNQIAQKRFLFQSTTTKNSLLESTETSSILISINERRKCERKFLLSTRLITNRWAEEANNSNPNHQDLAIPSSSRFHQLPNRKNLRHSNSSNINSNSSICNNNSTRNNSMQCNNSSKNSNSNSTNNRSITNLKETDENR